MRYNREQQRSDPAGGLGSMLELPSNALESHPRPDRQWQAVSVPFGKSLAFGYLVIPRKSHHYQGIPSGEDSGLYDAQNAHIPGKQGEGLHIEQ
ncbi:hypothetical protein RJT34_12626 [Clitoria ternatea]|uniref:Uncharacterized protein n=1 Tax=Clitoria ternatea TaxID=43366 RepID=A0AAN9JMD1_CLITE